jgi:hypothetical protein
LVIPASLSSPQKLSDYEGVYVSSLLGDATVSVMGAKLQLKLEQTEATLILDPQEPDAFLARLAPIGSFAPVVAMGGDDPITPIRFERDERGRIQGLRWLEPALAQSFDRRP